MVEMDNFLDEHLEHIGEALQQTHRAHTVRTKAALESGAKFTLVVYIEECEQGIDQKQAYTDQDTFYRSGEPSGHERGQETMNPLGDY